MNANPIGVEEKRSKGSALLMITNPVSGMEAKRTAMERMTIKSLGDQLNVKLICPA